MTALRRVCVAGLVGIWLVAGGAQETEGGAAAGEQEELEEQAVAPESGSAAAGAISQAGSSDLPGTAADASEADAGVTTDAGGAETGEALPQIAPLDELFVPSQNIRADEPVTFPVDF